MSNSVDFLLTGKISSSDNLSPEDKATIIEKVVVLAKLEDLPKYCDTLLRNFVLTDRNASDSYGLRSDSGWKVSREIGSDRIGCLLPATVPLDEKALLIYSWYPETVKFYGAESVLNRAEEMYFLPQFGWLSCCVLFRAIKKDFVIVETPERPADFNLYGKKLLPVFFKQNPHKFLFILRGLDTLFRRINKEREKELEETKKILACIQGVKSRIG